MDILKIAAFSDGNTGGNPAGVVLGDHLPDIDAMQRIAAEVGFSETAFAAPAGTGWRVRYFSPESEVPFCGHATIALGAALAMKHGDGVFALTLNEANITVEARAGDGLVTAALQSPPTRSMPASAQLVSDALELFGYMPEDLDERIPPAIVHGGARHLALVLKSRETLAAMTYALDAGRSLIIRPASSRSCSPGPRHRNGSTRAIHSHPGGSTKTRPRVPERRRLRVTCATLHGRTEASSMFCRARTWGYARACGPKFRPHPEVRFASRAPRASCTRQAESGRLRDGKTMTNRARAGRLSIARQSPDLCMEGRS